MSNSPKAKERRLRRQHLTKYDRDMMARQHYGDSEAAKKRAVWQDRAPRSKGLVARIKSLAAWLKSLVARLGLIKQYLKLRRNK